MIQLKNFYKIIIFLFLTLLFSCSSTNYTHQSGNNNYLSSDSSFCRTEANIYAPTYICRNPFMCAPDEFSIATQAILLNENYYKRCMSLKGYQKN